MTWCRIWYAGYLDVPRVFIVNVRNVWLLLESPLDDDDSYLDYYDIYRISQAVVPNEPVETTHLSVATLKAVKQHIAHVGRIPIKAVAFDATGVRCVDDAVFAPLGL